MTRLGKIVAIGALAAPPWRLSPFPRNPLRRRISSSARRPRPFTPRRITAATHITVLRGYVCSPSVGISVGGWGGHGGGWHHWR